MEKTGVDFQNLTELINRSRKERRSYLDFGSVQELMQIFRLPMPRGCLLPENPCEFDCLKLIPSPWVLKLISDDIQHKSGSGFIKLSLTSTKHVNREIDIMRESARNRGYRIEGFLVEEMVESGIEIVIGGYRDRVFGTTIMFGIGGILVEVLNDVVFRICPITVTDAEDMIDELSGKALFEGVRGGPVADRDTLIKLLLSIGGEFGLFMTVMEKLQEIDEIDLNPIIIRDRQFSVVDALISIKNSGANTAKNLSSV